MNEHQKKAIEFVKLIDEATLVDSQTLALAHVYATLSLAAEMHEINETLKQIRIATRPRTP